MIQFILKKGLYELAVLYLYRRCIFWFQHSAGLCYINAQNKYYNSCI